MKILKSKKFIPSKIRIAHRGLWDKINPENSMGAFKKALDKKIPIEFDIHILKDGTLAVFHDNNLKRMTGKDLFIKDLSKEDLDNIYLQNTQYKIPTIEEVLQLIGGQVLIDIEIKSDVKNFKICKELCKCLKDYDGLVLIKSFNPFYVAWFRFVMPQYTRGLLISEYPNSKFFKKIIFLIYLNWLCKPDFLAFNIDNLPNKKIEKLHKNKLPIFLWTVKANQELKYEYDGIIFEE